MKRIYLSISILVIVLILVFIFKINDTKKVVQNSIVLENQENLRRKEFNDDPLNYWNNICFDIFENGNIENQPVTKFFLSKYKNSQNKYDFAKKDIDITMDFEDWPDVRSQESVKQFLSYASDINTGNGMETASYLIKYDITNDFLLNDIIIIGERIWIDKNGHKVYYPKEYLFDDDSNPYIAISYFTRPHLDFEFNSIAVTENFKKKYPSYNQKGIFDDYDYMIIEELSKLDNHNYIFRIADLKNTKEFKIEVILDKNGYVDDIKKTLIKTEITRDAEYVQSVYDDYFA